MNRGLARHPQKDIPGRVGPENKTASSIKCERLFPWVLRTAQENEKEQCLKSYFNRMQKWFTCDHFFYQLPQKPQEEKLKEDTSVGNEAKGI